MESLTYSRYLIGQLMQKGQCTRCAFIEPGPIGSVLMTPIASATAKDTQVPNMRRWLYFADTHSKAPTLLLALFAMHVG